MCKDYAQAIKVYKSAMVILLKIYPDSLLLADRHCYLAELLCMGAKYQEAVKELEAAIARYEYYGRLEGDKFVGSSLVARDSEIGENVRSGLKD